jgi:hypothetical protein
MGDDVVYIRPPDWWPEPIPDGHVFLLLKSIYGTHQAAREWHTHISTWMENNGYAAINSERTILMKHKGAKYIIHGLFAEGGLCRILCIYQEIVAIQEGTDISGRSIQGRRDSLTSLPDQTEVLPFVCGEASVCGNMDPI